MAGLLALTLCTSNARANQVTFTTPGGSKQNSRPVDATAVFTTGAGTVTVTLTNNVVDPTSVVQNISGLFFTPASGQNSGSLTSSSGKERTVNSDGSFSDGSTVSTGWSLTGSGNGLLLNVLGTPEAPKHTILGAPNAKTGSYDNADSSITGNPHNPFLTGTVTFSLHVARITADSTVSAVQFRFNTDPGFTTDGVAAIPEPAFFQPAAMLTLGSLGALRLRRTRGKRA